MHDSPDFDSLNCGHSGYALRLSRPVPGGYTEEHEHLLICLECVEEESDDRNENRTQDN